MKVKFAPGAMAEPDLGSTMVPFGVVALASSRQVITKKSDRRRDAWLHNVCHNVCNIVVVFVE